MDLFLSRGYEGSVHETIIADAEGYAPPPKTILFQDAGYQGFVLADVLCRQPTKKPRNGSLTDGQKRENRAIRSARVAIEHAIGTIKRWKQIAYRWRLYRHEMHSMMMDIACGLHNFLIQ